MKRYILLILIFFSILPFQIFALTWQRKIVNYERNQYQAGFQNWMIAQSPKGVIYAANSNGVLEFDGVYWSLLTIPNRTVRALKVIDDRIYVGGSSEFGYFDRNTNTNENFTYHSISDTLKDWAGEVWDIYKYEEKIYFISDWWISIYKENEGLRNIPIHDLNLKIDCSVMENGRLYIGTPNGIYFLNDDNSVKPLEYCDILKGKKIVELLTYNNSLLAVTALSGIYRITSDKCEKLAFSKNAFIMQNQLFCASILDSKIALGSVQNGAYMFDLKNENYQEYFNIQTGLGNNTVLNLFFDADENLWLSLDKGIGYVILNSPLCPLYAKDSPIGTGYCAAEYNGIMYLGTNQGLYKDNKKEHLQMQEGGQGQIWSLLNYDNTLFAAGDNGISVITTVENYKINLQGAWEIHPLNAEKDKLIVATYSGFGILAKNNNKWVFSHMIPDFFYSTKGFIEDIKDYDFWFTDAKKKSINRITINPSLGYFENIEEYLIDEEHDIGENPYLRIINNNLCVCTSSGIYQYDRLSDEFIHYEQLENILEGKRHYDYLSADRFNNIWYVSDGKLRVIPYLSGNYTNKKYEWDLSKSLIEGYINVYVQDSCTAIVGIDNSFLKINFSDEANTNNDNDVFIKKLILSKNDSIINLDNKKVQELSFPFSLNSMSFYFGAINYTASEVLYSYILEGVDTKWSLPSTNTQKEYTNIPEGKYIFKVKAIINGVEQNDIIASVEFEIHPPWYRSILAYIIYTFSIIALIALFIKKLNDKYKKDLQQKKQELIEQKRKHEEESRLKDQEIYQLQNESLQSELKYKTQELTGKVLNLLRKNEILEDVKRLAVGISKAIDEQKETPVIKQRIIRLIAQINNSIEHDDDFEIFKSNFDLIHKDFFKLLDEKHPGLTRNEKILCAYLKMNFSSKEIAPLFNISLRGVEVNRYRLRKKMNLDRTINISEYLQNLSE